MQVADQPTFTFNPEEDPIQFLRPRFLSTNDFEVAICQESQPLDLVRYISQEWIPMSLPGWSPGSLVPTFLNGASKYSEEALPEVSIEYACFHFVLCVIITHKGRVGYRSNLCCRHIPWPNST